ncbi:BZ3500_MvSof-1268-A1-R1_Chr2-2g05183 [Microbotryum saponariae]|uniref:BZ3500_MvSof-1268-A1-R1_Chr2-2g05183 protein n=1 Tax=Microbotryum saponariae TaxID=289078 RepID=A0A2X0L7P7_9BASI|nr:BZ3500_MvSof-1268-A1-R1_Chr2-2g05183 [Microbotryum saponariae]SDA01010.1 BZ3501_MvSof-1269-A2-R1_Chr2-2g04857 [Microbotryum saponariae]
MGLLETSISEEVPFHSKAQKRSSRDGDAVDRHEPSGSGAPPPPPPPPPPQPSASSASSGSGLGLARQDASSHHTLSARESNKKIEEKNKVIAAMVGATLTSLTMTPFDVVKTRLQTQPSQNANSSFIPASHLPPPTSRSTTSPWPPPIASTSTAPPESSVETKLGSKLSTCCTKTYFNSNDKSLLCRFDPRHSTSSLPASGSHSSPISAARAAFVHHFAPAAPIPHPGSMLLHASNGAALFANACLYPDPRHAVKATSSGTIGGSASAASPTHLTGFWDAVIKIARNEGISSLWRGTAPALAMSVPGQVVYMVGYDWGRRTAFDHAPQWAYAEVANADGRHLSKSYLTAVPLIAGGMSRTVVAALTSPLELVRTRLQSTSDSTSVRSIILTLRAEGGGLSSAWRGLPPTLWRDVPFSAIYWAGYEAIKRSITGGKGMGEGWQDQSLSSEFAVAFVSGAGSGMIAATVTNPFDVVKTRRQALVEAATVSGSSSTQAPLTKTFPILFDIAKKEGWAGLMRGLTPRLAKHAEL